MGIGSFLKGIAGDFIGSIFGSLGDAAGTELTDAVFGPNNLPSRRDYDQYQDLLNSSADDEGGRDAIRHNTFADHTLAGDMARYGQSQPFLRSIDREQNVQDIGAFGAARADADQAYMDQVYAGTSNWERLGSSAAPSLSMNAPSKPAAGQQKEGGFLPSLMPLMAAQMQTENQTNIAKQQQRTAESVAEIQGETARDVASINAETQLATNHQSTFGGQLPASQAALAAAQQLQTEANTQKTYQEISNQTVANFLSVLPTETIDLGLIKFQQKPGWEKILPILSSEASPGEKRNAINQAINSLPGNDWGGIKRDAIELAAMVGKTAQGVKGFLPNIGFGKKPPKINNKGKWRRPDGTYVD